MTKPLQEMLHQLSMLVANLVAMAERIKQLDQMAGQYHVQLQMIHEHSSTFLKDDQDIQEQTLNLLPENFEQDFTRLMASAPAEQQVILASLKMDIRHFIQNIRAIRLIWQRIQQGDASLPESVTPLTTTYPHLHRDHGVALRGGISAFIVVIIATGFWILSGWKAGFMMAEMAAISACILTAMDNPVPALKMFVRGNIYAGVLVFIYAYGIFPHLTSFWELALVLAPFVIYCLMMFPHPPLTGIALPSLMGTIMGLNLQNRYTLDQVFFFDASIGSVLGPIISIYIIHLVRAMSPEITVQRILSQHYQAIRQALYIPYGVQFRIHLRSMLDRIGILNTKMVQSEKLKTQIHLALVESSAVIDLTRLQELMHRLDSEQAILASLEDLQQGLDDYFRAKEHAQQQLIAELHQQVILKISQLKKQVQQLAHAETSLRIQMSLNNICSSLCHEQTRPNEPAEPGGVAHG